MGGENEGEEWVRLVRWKDNKKREGEMKGKGVGRKVMYREGRLDVYRREKLL